MKVRGLTSAVITAGAITGIGTGVGCQNAGYVDIDRSWEASFNDVIEVQTGRDVQNLGDLVYDAFKPFENARAENVGAFVLASRSMNPDRLASLTGLSGSYDSAQGQPKQNKRGQNDILAELFSDNKLQNLVYTEIAETADIGDVDSSRILTSDNIINVRDNLASLGFLLKQPELSASERASLNSVGASNAKYQVEKVYSESGLRKVYDLMVVRAAAAMLEGNLQVVQQSYDFAMRIEDVLGRKYGGVNPTTTDGKYKSSRLLHGEALIEKLKTAKITYDRKDGDEKQDDLRLGDFVDEETGLGEETKKSQTYKDFHEETVAAIGDRSVLRHDWEEPNVAMQGPVYWLLNATVQNAAATGNQDGNQTYANLIAGNNSAETARNIVAANTVLLGELARQERISNLDQARKGGYLTGLVTGLLPGYGTYRAIKSAPIAFTGDRYVAKGNTESERLADIVREGLARAMGYKNHSNYVGSTGPAIVETVTGAVSTLGTVGGIITGTQGGSSSKPVSKGGGGLEGGGDTGDHTKN